MIKNVEYGHEDVVDVIAFTKVRLPFGWLGNMAPFPIVIGGERWPTTEHLFQAMRFNDKDIKAQIRAERSPMSAKMVAHKWATRRVVIPLSVQDVTNMRLCLWSKLLQHPQIKSDLVATGDELIIEDVTRRKGKGSAMFWGAALVDGRWVGENQLGQLWMELRRDLKHCCD